MIDPSLRTVLRSRYTIRRFFVMFSLLLVGLLTLLWLITALGPEHAAWREASANFLGNFAASVAVFLVVYGFYVYITPPGLRNAEVVPLRDVEIGDEIIRASENISNYWFWGRSGNYFRSVVLPKLDETARLRRRRITIKVVLPDPSQAGSGELYRRLKVGLGEPADGNTLSANVLATVIATVQACRANPYLKAEIGLSRTVPVLRYDLSSAGGLITRDAKKLPAILVNAHNPYFDMLQDAVENELAQSGLLFWDEVTAVPPNTDPFTPEFLLSIRGLPSFGDDVVVAAREEISKASRYV